MATDRNYVLVAAIDFGTTYSGYAFSFRHEYDKDPLTVSAKTWTAGSGNLMSLKTSTAVLFTADQTFDSFGFEAEDKYEELAMENEHKDWYLFRRFKMELYDTMSLKRSFLLYDATGKTMPAMKVFSSSLCFLKNELKNTCEKQGFLAEDSDVKWVLTVPAIWTDAAKQFMREAAEHAGIPQKHLLIALEPEAASLYCKELPVDRRGGVGFEAFQPGSKYLVLDAGGGTVDITVHEVLGNKAVKEIYKANGGNWGGTAVDTNFSNMLSNIVGKHCFDLFMKNQSSDYLEMMRDFELRKRLVKNNESVKLTLRIPAMLNELCKMENEGRTFEEMIQENEEFMGKITVISD